MKEKINKIKMIANTEEGYYFVLFTNSISIHVETKDVNKYKIGDIVDLKISSGNN